MEAGKRVLQMDEYVGKEEGEAASSEAADAKRLKEEQPSEEDSHSRAVKTIEDLPEKVLIEIFSFLPLQELVTSVKSVCRRWRATAQDSRVFRTLAYVLHFNNTTEEHVVRLLEAAPKLQTVLVYSRITPRVLESLCRNCKDLRQVGFGSRNIDVLGAIVDACPMLERINIGGDPPTKLLAPLGRCRSLKTLRLDVEVLSDDLFTLIAEGCPHLEKLRVPRTRVGGDGLHYLLQKRGRQLTSLHLTCCINQNCLIPVVAKQCTQLRNLGVRGHHKMSEKYYVLLFTSAAAARLERLELLSIRGLDRQATGVLFRSCRNLSSLKIEYREEIDEYLMGIELLVNLRSLDLSFCQKLTDRGVVHVVECTSLRELILDACFMITEQTLYFCCKKLPDLRSLQMRCMLSISSAAVLMVPKYLKKLKHLTIMGHNLEESVQIIENLLPGLKVDLNEMFTMGGIHYDGLDALFLH